jgi:hypothetical protein
MERPEGWPPPTLQDIADSLESISQSLARVADVLESVVELDGDEIPYLRIKVG